MNYNNYTSTDLTKSILISLNFAFEQIKETGGFSSIYFDDRDDMEVKMSKIFISTLESMGWKVNILNSHPWIIVYMDGSFE
jgi:hypothetical protein